MKDGHMPLSNSLPLLQMYKHTYIQTFKLGSGEHKAGGQLTYSNLLAGQSFVDVLGIFTAKGSTLPMHAVQIMLTERA